jgi:hypothetical protein
VLFSVGNCDVLFVSLWYRKGFVDSSTLYYRFRSDDGTDDTDTAPFLAAACDSKAGYLARKAFLRWKTQYFVLQVSGSSAKFLVPVFVLCVFKRCTTPFIRGETVLLFR